jgi:AcrR family transcriptional regulator
MARKIEAPTLVPDRRTSRPRRSNAVQTKPSPPTTGRGRATRARLKGALLELLHEHPFHEIRLEDITTRAGVRVSLFYHYFQSKIDLTQEVLAEILNEFRNEVENYPKNMGALNSIHFANSRMVHLYVTHPGAMRCILEVRDGMAPFAPIWREMTLDWNRRIAESLTRRFTDSFQTPEQYLALAYALSGMVDNFLYEYYVLENPLLRQTYGTPDDVALFLTVLWYRSIYLENPPADFLGALAGFSQMRSHAGSR